MRDLEASRQSVLEDLIRVVLGSDLANELDILLAVRLQGILREIRIVEVLPVDRASLLDAIFLDRLSELNHALPCDLLLLDAVDHQLHLKHDGVVGYAV